MTRLFQLAWEAMRRRLISARVSELAVCRVLLEQRGVAAVESVRFVPGTTSRRQLQVRLRIADGCDAREVSLRATEELMRNLPVTEIRLLVSADDRPAAGP